jgi:hypothetical protein
MKNQWRDQFIVEASRAGIALSDARALLLRARTIQRLAEAQCNGDWPADNGEGEAAECPRCSCLWAPSVIKSKGCPDCRAQDKVTAILAPYGFEPIFQGDPRGCVLSIKTPTQEISVPS